MGDRPLAPEQQAAVLAVADLAHRAGATGFRIGYNPDDTPTTWFAAAEYGPNTEITVDGFDDPEAAANALAARILTGGKCRCGKLVALSIDGAYAPGDDCTMLDGSDPRVLRTAGQCLWMLEGDQWTSGCDAPPLSVADNPTYREITGRGNRPT